MNTTRLLGIPAGYLLILTGCIAESEPRSAEIFLSDPIALEATISRCNEDRAGTWDDAECKNAREAVRLLSSREDKQRRARLEEESEKKRRALRDRFRELAEIRARAEAEAKAAAKDKHLEQIIEVQNDNASTDSGNNESDTKPDDGAPADTGSVAEALDAAGSVTEQSPQ